ncbi:hypothetical protein MMC08_006443 [Hypocenomyce scalaris]|nr:hypothetical protein [Hypocenomyce scalaris]
MAYPTVPAFEHYGSWDAETRKHPAMAWMESYTLGIIDAKKFSTPYNYYHGDNFSFQLSNGTIVQGGAAAWEAAAQVYAPFPAHLHEPSYLLATESASGWKMLGVANVYFALPGPPSAEAKVKDLSGKEWDVVVPSSFHFEYEKSDKAKEGGIVLKSTKIYGDTAPVLVRMLKQGLVKPEDLMK